MGRIPFFLLISAFPAVQAGIFPDQLGPLTRGAPATLAAPDQALYAEYGLETTEQAEYKGDGKRLNATLWRLKDSTGAMALFQARRPSGAVPGTLTPLTVKTADGIIFAYGNYLFQMTGSVPPESDLAPFLAQLPKLEQSPLPALIGFLPKDSLVPNSERYILGPASLDRFQPGIPPSAVAFSVGAEGESGKYKTAKGTMTLTIFNYPTPSLARERADEFRKIPGVVAKRSGPLVAIIAQPPDGDAAERLLAQVKYEANLTWNEKVPQNEVRGFAGAILSMFVLAGILIGLSTILGIGFGGFRILLRKMGKGEDPNALTVLHLNRY